jgi:hypothetical protein
MAEYLFAIADALWDDSAGMSLGISLTDGSNGN